MSDPSSGSVALIAWTVAVSMAASFGGVAFGLVAYRRRREMESRLQALEGAVEDFCSALRLRLDMERSRRRSPQASDLNADTHEAA